MNSVSAGSEVGIDVSKDWLDVSVDAGKAFRVSNDRSGYKKIASRIAQGSRIHLEASGGYERPALRFLENLGFEVQTHDPFKVRRAAQAKGQAAKTDALDAVHLSSEGASLQASVPKSAEREALCDLSRAADELKKIAAQIKTRMKAPGLSSIVRASYRRAIRDLQARVAELEKEFVRQVKRSCLKESYELALSVPGAGPCLARVLVCELPENLEEFSDAQIASYAGVAPIDRSSGKRKKASIGKGNLRVKGALYMPALCCIRSQDWAKDCYRRLRAKAKEHPQAAIAVMRRLLIRVVQVMRRGTPWVVKPPKALT